MSCVYADRQEIAGVSKSHIREGWGAVNQGIEPAQTSISYYPHAWLALDDGRANNVPDWRLAAGDWAERRPASETGMVQNPGASSGLDGSRCLPRPRSLPKRPLVRVRTRRRTQMRGRRRARDRERVAPTEFPSEDVRGQRGRASCLSVAGAWEAYGGRAYAGISAVGED